MKITRSVLMVAGWLVSAAWPVLGQQPAADRPKDLPRTDGDVLAPAPESGKPWTQLRVGGDLFTVIEKFQAEDEKALRYRCGRSRITTPLPVGYPDPTPPGAIELKKYPSVRRAEVSGTMNPDIGMSAAFFPLFRHIERNKIAMTSPVEMDYSGLKARGDQEPRDWTMSFLYRTPELHGTGKEGNVVIVDTKPLTVVSIGIRGSYSTAEVQKALVELEAWLKTSKEWEQDGEPRALYYNGPDVSPRDKWGEVQVPVKAASNPPPDGKESGR